MHHWRSARVASDPFLPSREEAPPSLRELWKVPMHGVYAPPDPTFLLGLQPGVPVLCSEPGGCSHLHVPGQRDLLPLHRGRGRRGLLRRQALLVLPGQLLRTLVLHGRPLPRPALPGLLSASHGPGQTGTEVLRQRQQARLPLQELARWIKHPGL